MKGKIVSIIFLLLLIFPLFYATSIVPSEQSVSTSSEVVSSYSMKPSEPKDNETESTGFIHVWWDQRNETESQSWNWSFTDWIFGPMPGYSILFTNDTPVTHDKYIPFDTWMKLKFIVPQNLFKKGATLGDVSLSFSTYTQEMSAGFVIGYDAVEDRFYHWSWQHSYGEYGGEERSYDEYSGPVLIDINASASTVSFDGQKWEIVIYFKVLSEAPVGVYHTYLSIQDNFGGYISFDYWRWGELAEIEFEYAIGASFEEIALLQPGWLMEILNLDNETIQGVSPYEHFKIKVSINYPNPGLVYFRSWIPGGYEKTITVYDYHEEVIHKPGGWVFDEEKNTFVWDPDVDVHTTRFVYGPRNITIWVPQDIDFEVTLRVYDPYEGTYYNYTAWREAFYVYNFTSGEFGQYIGYEYWNYTLEDGKWVHKRFLVLESEISSDQGVRYFLDLNASVAYEEEGYHVVEFVGYLTKLVREGEDFWVGIDVLDDKGEYIPPSPAMDWERNRITVGGLVADAFIIDPEGKPVHNWVYHVPKNGSFMVAVCAKGTEELIDDIDGVRIIFETYEDYYLENESRWSTLQAIVTYSMVENETTIEIYNATYRYVYVYGPYWDWILVNKTGWHYEYNASSGEWVWTYGDYQTWEYTKVEGWHWEYQSYDREKGEWTAKYIDLKDPRNLIENIYLNVTEVIVNRTDTKLCVGLNITVTDKTPDRSFHWYAEVLNYTFGIDYSKPYGEYTVLQWTEETIYSFMNASEKVYVKRPEEANVVEIMGKEYLVKSIPYIVIGNKQYPIKVKEYIDPWSGETRKEILFYGEYNPEKMRSERYYELLENGTKIYVDELKVAPVFKYNISGVGIIYTYLRGSWYNEFTGTEFLIALNGTVYNVGSMHVSVDQGNGTLVDIVHLNITDIRIFTLVNYSFVLELATFMEYDPYTDTYFILLENGTRFDLEFSSEYYKYYFTHNGVKYYIEWPVECYVGTYNRSGIIEEVLVPIWEARSIFYTVINNKTYELPKPKAKAFDWWDIERTESEGGKVPEFLYAINGSDLIPIYRNETSGEDYVTIDGSNITVFIQRKLVTEVAGDTILDVEQIGFRCLTFTYENLSFVPDDYINIRREVSWYEEYMYLGNFYNATLGEFEFKLLNGTKVYGEEVAFLDVYELHFDNVTIYTTSQWPVDYEYVNETARYTWELINGSLFTIEVPNVGYYGYTHFRRLLVPIIYKNYTFIAEYTEMSGTLKAENIRKVLVSSSDVLYNSTGDYYYILADMFDNGTYVKLRLTPLSDWYAGSYSYLTFEDHTFYGWYYGYFLYNTTFFNGTHPVELLVAAPRHSEETLTNKVVLNGTIYELGHDIQHYWYKRTIALKYSFEGLYLTEYIEGLDYRPCMPIFNITLPNGTIVTVYPAREYILKNVTYWGHPKGWMLMPFPNIWVHQRTWEIIVGLPRKGMWGYRAYTINPENGAVDLDGDLSTTDDQFYIKRVHMETSYFERNASSMFVFILWDPNSTVPDDELIVTAWMGIATHSWRTEWNETFFWYYPNGTLVSKETLEWINSTIIDPDTGEPLPGYWELAIYMRNYTWEDVVREAEERGWDWITDEPVTWTWLWFGIEEHYWGVWYNETTGDISSAGVRLRYEFAGLMIYNDTDSDGLMDIEISGYEVTSSEITHYFIPTCVSKVIFTTPGAAYNVTNTTGALDLPLDAEVTFGIEYLDVEGKTMPFFGGYGYWDWWGTVPSGSDFESFDERPTDAYIDNLMFLVHFMGNSTPTAELENVTIRSASIKIDQHVGNWDVDIAGGRDVLENRSLSINWYVFTETVAAWSFTINGTPVDNNEIVSSLYYQIGVGSYRLAEIKMGETYVWGKNTSKPYDIFSQTVPLNTFVVAYVSESGNSTVSGWAITSTMYFLSVGFPEWDGFYVYNDPETVVYLGSRVGYVPGMPDSTGPIISDVTIEPERPGPGDTVTVRFSAYDPESSVAGVEVLYSVNDGDNVSVPVTPLENNFYEAVLGSFNAGDIVKVYILAWNTYGVKSYHVIQITISEVQPTGPGGPPPGIPIPLLIAVSAIIVIIAIIVIKKRKKTPKF